MNWAPAKNRWDRYCYIQTTFNWITNTSENHDGSSEVFLFSFGTIIINNRVFAYPPHFGGRNLLEHRYTKGLKA